MRRLNRRGGFDVLIVARGGGSPEGPRPLQRRARRPRARGLAHPDDLAASATRRTGRSATSSRTCAPRRLPPPPSWSSSARTRSSAGSCGAAATRAGGALPPGARAGAAFGPRARRKSCAGFRAACASGASGWPRAARRSWSALRTASRPRTRRVSRRPGGCWRISPASPSSPRRRDLVASLRGSSRATDRTLGERRRDRLRRAVRESSTSSARSRCSRAATRWPIGRAATAPILSRGEVRSGDAHPRPAARGRDRRGRPRQREAPVDAGPLFAEQGEEP